MTTSSTKDGRPRATREKRPKALSDLLDAVPPQDLDAEKAVVGSLILDPRRLAEVQDIIGPEHCYDHRNEILLRHVCRLANQGTAIDVITLQASLKETGEVERAGGAAYLAEVAHSVPVAAHAAYHAGLVKRAADRRAVQRLGADLIRVAHAGEADGQGDLLAEARELLDALGARANSPTRYPAFTGPELDSQRYETEFLVEGVLPQGHHTILGGPHKSLKTLIGCDLSVSLATGGHFLGYFRVPRAVPVAYMSGECGLPIMQANLRRIARAAGTELGRLDNLLVTDRLPTFGNAADIAAMGEFIRDNGVRAVVVDPAYLALPSEDAGNVFAMGALLRGMAETFVASGATMILLHHATKISGMDGEPLDLNALSWAGFREFAANWLLVSRREKYEPGSGLHRLWLSVGGREGHGGLWGVDVNEGPYVAGVERQWEVTVSKPDEARAVVREAVQAAKEREKEEKRRARLEEAKKRILEAAARRPEGDSKTRIRDRSGVHPREFDEPFQELLAAGALVPCDIFRGNRKKPIEGYKLGEGETPYA
jgi:hypothetical protein